MGTTDEGDADLAAGVRWLCRQKCAGLVAEEARLVPLLARGALALAKARLRHATELGEEARAPWPVSPQEFAALAPDLLALRDRLRRVRALARRMPPQATEPRPWLFWEPDVLGPLTAAGLMHAGEPGWLDAEAPVGGVNRYLLREGAVPGGASCVWCQHGNRGGWADGDSPVTAELAFEVYAAACAGWQALLDWDLRRLPDPAADDGVGAPEARLERLAGVLLALREDSRPSLLAVARGAGLLGQADARPCPLVRYAEGLVAGVRELGRQCRRGAVPAVLERLASGLHGAMCACILGPPGTGKTRAARQAAGLYHGLGLLLSDDYRELGRGDLVGGYIGETEERTRRALQSSVEGFVLLDEAYALAGTARRGARHATDDYGPVALAALVQFLTSPDGGGGGRVAVWAAGYRGPVLRDFLGANAGVPSRFPVRLEWPALTAGELVGVAVRAAGPEAAGRPGAADALARALAGQTAREAEAAGWALALEALRGGAPATVDDPAVARGVERLLGARLAEYGAELDRVARQLAAACRAAVLERHALAVLHGGRLGTTPLMALPDHSGVAAPRARYQRLRALLLAHGAAPDPDGACHAGPADDAPPLHGVAWLPASDGAPQFDGRWVVVGAGTERWRRLGGAEGALAGGSHPDALRPCGYRPGATARQRKAPHPGAPPRPRADDGTDPQAFSWRVPAGLAAWDLPARGVPWAAVTCPWLDPGFVREHVLEAERRLWLAETGFDTRRLAVDASAAARETGRRLAALRGVVDGLRALARADDWPPPGGASTAAVPDGGAAARIERELREPGPGTPWWQALLAYVAGLVSPVAVLGDRPDALALVSEEIGRRASVVLTGPSGTGKTEAARLAARALYGAGALLTDEVREVGRCDLVAAYVGQTEARTLGVLNGALESVLFIDEAYSLGLSTGPEDYGNVAAAVLVQFMTARENRGRVAVWAAGYRRAMRRSFLGLNEGLAGRFPVRLGWGALDRRRLGAIVADHLAGLGIGLTPIGAGVLLWGLGEGRVAGGARAALRLAALVAAHAGGATRLGAEPVRAAVGAWHAERGGRRDRHCPAGTGTDPRPKRRAA